MDIGVFREPFGGRKMKNLSEQIMTIYSFVCIYMSNIIYAHFYRRLRTSRQKRVFLVKQKFTGVLLDYTKTSFHILCVGSEKYHKGGKRNMFITMVGRASVWKVVLLIEPNQSAEIGSATNVVSCNHTFLVAVEGYQQLSDNCFYVGGFREY